MNHSFIKNDLFSADVAELRIKDYEARCNDAINAATSELFHLFEMVPEDARTTEDSEGSLIDALAGLRETREILISLLTDMPVLLDVYDMYSKDTANEN